MLIQPVFENDKLIGYRCVRCGKTVTQTSIEGACSACTAEERENNIKFYGNPKGR